MERYYGFDLGDAESAVSYLDGKEQKVPELIPVRDSNSFITACAVTAQGEVLIGEEACYAGNASRRKLRFKSRFLTDPGSEEDLKAFAGGVLGELYTTGGLVKGSDSCFYIGCPAGWDRNARERYRAIFERVGYPPAKIVSESRAALVSACQSKHLQVGYDILSKPVLVVDIGSSTTDFAYVCGGHEVEMLTAGEVFLGGGIMDELLLEEAISASKDAGAIREVFAECEPWKNYCEFAARRLKERYFSDAGYYGEEGISETILIQYRKPVRLTIRMDRKIAEKLYTLPSKRIGNRSFQEVFENALSDVREAIPEGVPELLFLTGGVSKLPVIREWCMRAFPESIIISGAEPEFSVARGLAWSGRIDAEMREFRAELEVLKNGRTVEDLVSARMDDLYREAVAVLVDPILEHAAVPVFDRWRNGEIERLADTDEELKKEINAYLRSDEARELMMKPIARWLKPIADDLEEYTVPICIRHNVPYTALSLNSYLAVSDIDIKLDARGMFAVQEITLMIDSIISILVGLLCGGSGIAMISTGPEGIIAGILLSLLVLILGKKKMEKGLLDLNLPKPIRKMVPKNAFRSRLTSVSAEVKKNLMKSLEEEKNDEISERLVDEISSQIEECLTRMAEVVEIPLG